LEAALSYDLEHFANITADCPMMDPKLINRAVMEYKKSYADLLKYDDSNDDLPFNCYLIKMSALGKSVPEKE